MRTVTCNSGKVCLQTFGCTKNILVKNRFYIKMHHFTSKSMKRSVYVPSTTNNKTGITRHCSIKLVWYQFYWTMSFKNWSAALNVWFVLMNWKFQQLQPAEGKGRENCACVHARVLVKENLKDSFLVQRCPLVAAIWSCHSFHQDFCSALYFKTFSNLNVGRTFKVQSKKNSNVTMMQQWWEYTVERP